MFLNKKRKSPVRRLCSPSGKFPVTFYLLGTLTEGVPLSFYVKYTNINSGKQIFFAFFLKKPLFFHFFYLTLHLTLVRFLFPTKSMPVLHKIYNLFSFFQNRIANSFILNGLDILNFYLYFFLTYIILEPI